MFLSLLRHPKYLKSPTYVPVRIYSHHRRPSLLCLLKGDAIAPAVTEARAAESKLREVRQADDADGDLKREFDAVSAEHAALTATTTRPETGGGSGSGSRSVPVGASSASSSQVADQATSPSSSAGDAAGRGTGTEAQFGPSRSRRNRRPRGDEPKQSPTEPRTKRQKR